MAWHGEVNPWKLWRSITNTVFTLSEAMNQSCLHVIKATRTKKKKVVVIMALNVMLSKGIFFSPLLLLRLVVDESFMASQRLVLDLQ